MEFPIRPALAHAVPTLPTGPDWHFEIKLDGHRMIVRRTEDGVVCYSRAGRIVTSHWMDLAVPAWRCRRGPCWTGLCDLYGCLRPKVSQAVLLCGRDAFASDGREAEEGNRAVSPSVRPR
ncbi:hypothetical protein ABZ771_34545 [Streptomyces globisporus]|uniref:ATP-dependent DNA ligase n=1 Tax=Streptomyces globisporus TaxID=1908 RepID=UPI003460CD6D